MKRSTVGLAGAAAAGALFLAGCGSPGGTAASTTSATTAPAATSASAAISASAATSAAASSTVSSSLMASMSDMSSTSMSLSQSEAATTVGGDVSELDAQSVTWFQTFCGGVSQLSTVATDAQGIDSPAEAGQLLGTIGTTFTETGQKLSALPPPTFEGGQQLATTAQDVMNKLGPSFVEFGQKASAIDPKDEAAGQQFATEFQQQFASLEDIKRIELSDDVKAAVETQVPECAFLASDGGTSAAPTS